MDERGERPDQKAEATQAEDRISNLPDGLLTYILSFLSTKDSVRTSVLSTRWKCVWVYVPVLDVRDWEFLPRGDHFQARNKRKKNFLAFVSRFLNQSNIYSCRKFCLIADDPDYDQSLLESWICAAKNPNIEELLLDVRFCWPPGEREEDECWWYLFLSYRPLYPVFQHKNSLPHVGKLYIKSTGSPPSVLESLVSHVKGWNFRVLGLENGDDQESPPPPPSLFGFEKLTVLKLESWWNVQFPKASIRFPNLKCLHLRFNIFANDGSVANLISSCPVLEELYFDGFAESLMITSPTLKYLKVRGEYFGCRGRDIVIDAPALEFLEIRDISFANYALGDLGAVVTAKVGVRTLSATFHVLRKIPNVKHLLLGCSRKALEETGSYYPLTFHHLTSMAFCGGCSWQFILNLLKMAPCLKDLFFEELIFRASSGFDFMFEQEVPHCLISNLQTIVIGKVWCKNAVEAISCFLKYCKVLKQMKIGFWSLPEDKEEVIKQAVRGMPKGSISCQIEFWEMKSPKFWEMKSSSLELEENLGPLIPRFSYPFEKRGGLPPL